MKKRNKLIFLISSIIISTTYFTNISKNIIVNANDKGSLMIGAQERQIYGAGYWHTSNLREWLNSEGVVNYTNNAPSTEHFGKYAYDKELGFLSNFTADERNGIAVTNLNSTIISDDASVLGISGQGQPNINNYTPDIAFNIPKILSTWKHLSVKNDNDKVFTLSTKEMIVYYQQRGWEVLKELTPEVRQKYLLTDTKYDYTLRGSRKDFAETIMRITKDNNSVIGYAYGKDAYGLVPAMHLKKNIKVKQIKEYDINNTKDTSWKNVNKEVYTQNLNIGDIITFGTYLGKHIEWRVINISENGLPLIATEKVIDIKPFDAPGDYAYSKSNIIFNNSDTTLNDDYFYNVQNTNDRTLPTIRVVNEEELFSRQVGSFTLNIEVKDGSGVSRVILPDGNVINSPPESFNYTVSTNGFHYFKVVDNRGNYKPFIIPVGNINAETGVMVNQSEKNWTNKNVNVNIKASNDVNFYKDQYNINARDNYPYSFPNLGSYAGKRIKISADMELVSNSIPVGNTTTSVGLSYHYVTKEGDEYVRYITWIKAGTVSLRDLQDKGKQHVEVETIIPGNYLDGLRAFAQIDVSHQDRSFIVKHSNVKYELIDDNDFRITKIELPNGTIINNKEYSYDISEEGIINHNYKIYDNRNMINNKSITTKIDKTNPIISIKNQNKDWTKNNVSVSINFLDNLSGLKEIVTPFVNTNFSGDKSFDTIIEFDKNGIYPIKAVDLAGNETIYNIEINNIDKIAPTISVTKEINPDKSFGYLNISANDNAKLKEIVLPNGTKITEHNYKYKINLNGIYLITAIDEAGNSSVLSIEVTELNNTGGNVDSDNLPNGNIGVSGIERIEYKLSGATIKDWTTYDKPFYISNEGITYITARTYDKAGNISSEKTSEVKIDKTKPINNGIKIELK